MTLTTDKVPLYYNILLIEIGVKATYYKVIFIIICLNDFFKVVAPGNFIGPLTEALQIENQQNYKDRLFFNFCEHIDECIRWIKDHGSPPDFIAIVVDSANNTGIEDVSKHA